MKLGRILAAISCVLCASGCGNGSTVIAKSSPLALFNSSDLRNPPLAPAFGQWAGTCGLGLGGKVTGQMTLSISDTQFIQTVDEFQSDSCGGAATLSVVSVFDIVRTNQYQLVEGVSDLDLDLKLMSLQMTPSHGYARALNESLFCGQTDWMDDQARAVDQLNCAGYVTSPAGTEFHDYLRLSGATLTFGLDPYSRDPHAAPASRP